MRFQTIVLLFILSFSWFLPVQAQTTLSPESYERLTPENVHHLTVIDQWHTGIPAQFDYIQSFQVMQDHVAVGNFDDDEDTFTSVAVWQISTGERHTITGWRTHNPPIVVRGFTFSPRTHQLVLDTWANYQVFLWDEAAQAIVGEYRGVGSALSPDQRFLVAGSTVIDLDTGEEQSSRGWGAFVFSADSQRLYGAVAGFEGDCGGEHDTPYTVDVTDVIKQTRIAQIPLTGLCQFNGALTLSPTQTVLLADNLIIYVPRRSIISQLSDIPADAAMNSNGTQIAWVNPYFGDSILQLWTATDNTSIPLATDLTSSAQITYIPNRNSVILVDGQPAVLHIFNTNQMQQIHEMALNTSQPIDLSLSEDGRYVFVLSEEGILTTLGVPR